MALSLVDNSACSGSSPYKPELFRLHLSTFPLAAFPARKKKE
ncbi:hypothetical protein RG963_09895 [Methanosarcina sp. Z-7115]|uniref:Uncharacterized protein n=1 Tax=Methanosarcina baikalica TaxID=3073890 RepID=A0ABU2D265_9EURY|nr:hypothetical protein [Methanosarcina sp. Z-7115]MDR7666080.1 hypothetical protein [Methanosarcina sp. Z-7115]